jgi:hypothetical protein
MTNLETGEVSEYVLGANAGRPADVTPSRVRQMDCMDCHNRPTPIFRSPGEAVNLALAAGKIDPALPFIKRRGVELLTLPYESTGQALRAIEEGIWRFYGDRYPTIAQDRSGMLSQAIGTLQAIYRDNFFREMKVRWDVYPDHAKHLMSPGCFRCHDGQHKRPDGKVITRDGQACHTIMAQGRPPALERSMQVAGLTFRHPEDMGNAWREANCSDCHGGALP